MFVLDLFGSTSFLDWKGQVLIPQKKKTKLYPPWKLRASFLHLKMDGWRTMRLPFLGRQKIYFHGTIEFLQAAEDFFWLQHQCGFIETEP